MEKNNLKFYFTDKKNSQITIFIIIAIVLIGIALFFFFWGDLKATFSSVSPESYLQSCVEESAKEVLALVKNGGSITPENYVSFGGEKIDYLCYTNEYYVTCSVQQPLLKQHIESEIASFIDEKVENCMESLKDEFENRGYEVQLGDVSSEIELVPEKLNIEINSPLTLTKETSSSYSKFETYASTKLYNFVMIASSIVNWESTYGNTETTTYMNYYPDIKVEKYITEDGTKIYTLSDRETDENFKFATRSLAWPAGFGYDETTTPIR